jgi:GMP synthase-like glutamine amidotransferase
MKKLHVFQHVPFETAGIISQWAEERGYAIATTQFFDGQLPDTGGADWLVIMGGPMGVYDEAQYPWLMEEKKAIKQAIADGKVVLGICLGAQLIAEALGASIRHNLYREIGWFPVFLNSGVLDIDIAQVLPPQWEALHWHGDTFDIPEGARLLASSEACRNQAFIFSDRVVGLQFHLEMERSHAESLVRHCAAELDNDGYVQSSREILAAEAPFDQSCALMERILAYLDSLPVSCPATHEES